MENEKATEIPVPTEESSENGTETLSSPLPYEEMRGEIEALKETVRGIHRGQSTASELRTLVSLIPNADLSLLDEEAFSAIERGESLVCSYLLSERRKNTADEQNRKNALSSAGEARGGGDGLYSLEEIKNMDRRAVRRNFDKVMKSLEKAKGGF